MMGEMVSTGFEKKRQAMKKRLASLGKGNPVVAAAVKNQNPPMEDTKWKSWEVVDELVRAARKEYFDKEDGSMSDCVANLAKALSKLASQKGLDNGKPKGNNVDSEDDY